MEGIENIFITNYSVLSRTNMTFFFFFFLSLAFSFLAYYFFLDEDDDLDAEDRVVKSYEIISKEPGSRIPASAAFLAEVIDATKKTLQNIVKKGMN